MRPYTFCILLLIGLNSCKKNQINSMPNILDTPCTVISEFPNRIDSVYYDSLLYEFGVFDSVQFGDYVEEDSSLYKPFFRLSNFIDEAPNSYDGLNPKYPMVNLTIDHSNGYELDGLVKYGGFGIYCKNIIIEKNDEFILIDSKDEFQNLFQPIESEEEALSYVSIMTFTQVKYDFSINESFRFYVDDLNKSYAEETDGGYITMTFDYDTFGCGPHSHYYVKHFVDYDGNISLLEKQRIYEDPSEDYLCVD